jgi:hypothetical protein
MVDAINAGDDQMVEATILALSNQSRHLAPLALVVGAFVMLFQWVKLRFANWKLTLVQMLPAMWIWAAMIDLRTHALDGKELHVFRRPLAAPLLLVIESHWESWRLQTLETRMEPWETTTNEEARSRGATHLRRGHKLSVSCGPCEMNSAPHAGPCSGSLISSDTDLKV